MCVVSSSGGCFCELNYKQTNFNTGELKIFCCQCSCRAWMRNTSPLCAAAEVLRGRKQLVFMGLGQGETFL